jgi:hypothetical protein
MIQSFHSFHLNILYGRNKKLNQILAGTFSCLSFFFFFLTKQLDFLEVQNALSIRV